MAVYNKFEVFPEDLIEGVHDFDAHVFKIMLTNTAPVATNTVKANLTELAAGAGYTAGGTATTVTTGRTAGTAKATGTDVTFTAAGGSIGPFRYAVLYNDTPATAPVDPLIGWWDYGSSITLADGENFLVDLDQVNGIFTLA